MWMILVGVWLISLVGVTYFLQGSARYRDGDAADDTLPEHELARQQESGRLSGVYYARGSLREPPAPRSDANVA